MRNVILGTDWWTDCDDAVAVRLLCRAHRRGEVRLLGIGVNACMADSAASLSAFLTAEGVEVPVGLDRDACYADTDTVRCVDAFKHAFLLLLQNQPAHTSARSGRALRCA